MTTTFTVGNLTSWAFAVLLIMIGILNIVLVHPVPGIAYLFLALIFFPPVNAYLKERFNFSFPIVVKIILGIIILMFTLGVSDLGDMIDKW